MSRLRNDPDWVRRREEQEHSRRIAVDKLRAAAKPVIRDLTMAGFAVRSVYDLVNTNKKYEAAIPILLKHLSRDYPNSIREGIARSLGRRWARDFAWGPVLDAYLQEPNKIRSAPPGEIGAPSGPKDGLAVALSHMARPEDRDQLVGLISDPKNGPSRIFFVQNLSRSKSPQAFETLVRLSDDPELKIEIAFRLRRKLQRQAKKDQARSSIRQ
jgi:HEAT repeat protein